MTREEAIKELKSTIDPEYDHCHADGVLCDLLISLGYEDVVKA